MLFYVLFVCKCVLPPGDNPIEVNKYIIYVKTGEAISGWRLFHIYCAEFFVVGSDKQHAVRLFVE